MRRVCCSNCWKKLSKLKQVKPTVLISQPASQLQDVVNNGFKVHILIETTLATMSRCRNK